MLVLLFQYSTKKTQFQVFMNLALLVIEIIDIFYFKWHSAFLFVWENMCHVSYKINL